MTALENPFRGDDWAGVRDQFLIEPGSAYLNHGSFGNTPAPVREVQAEWRQRMDVNATRFFRREIRPALDEARLAVAEYLGAADADGLTLVPNVTSGVSAVLAAFAPAPGDEELVTDVDACLRQRLQRPRRIRPARRRASRTVLTTRGA
jgi:isopenicillin-N epimerase